MMREDAFYYLNLMLLGISDGYDGYEEWLNNHLTSEEPLSDIVLELSWCFSDVNKTISLLTQYCAQQPFDEAIVAERLRLFFKEAFHSNRMSKVVIASYMYDVALNVDTPAELNMDIWGSMYWLEEHHEMAREGITSWEDFDAVFFAYLDDGIPIGASQTRSCNPKPERRSIPKKPSLLDRLKRWFHI